MAGGSLASTSGGRRRRSALAITVLGVLAAGMANQTPSPAASIDTPAIRRAVTTVEPSVVFIYVRLAGNLLDSRDGRVHGPLLATSKGTGWFVNPDGDIATATHVVAPNAADTKVALVDRYIVAVTGHQLATDSNGFAGYMRDTTVQDVTFSVRVISQGQHIPAAASDDDLFRLGRAAAVLASSPETATDISVLQVSGHHEPAVLLSDAPPPALGVPLAIIGYPRMSPRFSVTPTFTYGPLTSIGHGSGSTGLPSDATAVGVASDATILGTDAFAEHGDSGGPGVDDQAHAVGLVSFGALSGQPIFLVSAADIAQVLATAHRSNSLGPADLRWRAGLLAYEGADRRTALDDFSACAAVSPDNSGCVTWGARVSAELANAGGGSPLPAVVGAAAALLLVLVGALAIRARRRADPRG